MSLKLLPKEIESQCIHVVDQITYDQKELQTLYERLKHLEVDYSEIRDKATNGLFGSITLDVWEGEGEDDYPKPGENFMLEPEIQKLVSYFNPMVAPIGAGNIAITVYQPGFQFFPHIDFSRMSVIMFPIYPSGKSHAPIDWYSLDVLGDAKADINNKEKSVAIDEHDEEFYLGSTYYSDVHPTIANTQMVHGVRNDTDDVRIFLQLSMYDKFEDVISRVKSGQFLNVH